MRFLKLVSLDAASATGSHSPLPILFHAMQYQRLTRADFLSPAASTTYMREEQALQPPAARGEVAGTSPWPPGLQVLVVRPVLCPIVFLPH